jgi:hypothetical protein
VVDIGKLCLSFASFSPPTSLPPSPHQGPSLFPRLVSLSPFFLPSSVYTLANRLFIDENEVREAEIRLEKERKTNEVAIARYRARREGRRPLERGLIKPFCVLCLTSPAIPPWSP